MGIQFRKRNSSLIIGVLSVVIVALLIWIQGIKYIQQIGYSFVKIINSLL